MVMENTRTFGTVDYVIFVLSLVLSLFIGVFAGAKDWAAMKLERTGTMRELGGLKAQLVGGANMNPLPVALSLLASFLSAPFLLGTPAEIYMYGTMYTATLIAYLLAGPVTAHLFVPIYHRHQLTSSYEFIEKRFNGWIRLLGSLLFSLMMILYMAVVVYSPAAAFAQVTGLPTEASILGVGIICTLYTAFGGMKAVVWTDAVQMVIILAGILALIIEGIIDTGGVGVVWQRVLDGHRIQTDALSVDPRERHTWWTQLIGGFFVTLSITATNQAMIQRYLSIKTTKAAQTAVYYATIFQVLYLWLVLVLGLVMYAYYFHCDPVITGRISSKDQLIPIFVMDSLGDIYGLPGLFSASVFSASLSTVSSGVNALAAVLISDIVHPLYTRWKGKHMDDSFSARVTKGLSVIFGFATVALAFVAPFLGTTLLQIAVTVFGLVGGPLLGLFILAVFFPMANEWGALVGTLVSLSVTGWVSIGAIIYPSTPIPLDLFATNCSAFGFDAGNYTQVKPTPRPDDGFDVMDIYSISYMWYAFLSVVVCLLVGLPVSLCTGGNRDLADLDVNLFFAYHRKCTPCFNACHCERCFPLEDTEELEITHNYDTALADKRQSVDSVFGMYHDDPGLAKRTSIAIQLGATGVLSGQFVHRAPSSVFAIARPDPNEGPELAELSGRGGAETGGVHGDDGVHNVGFLSDEETVDDEALRMRYRALAKRRQSRAAANAAALGDVDEEEEEVRSSVEEASTAF